MTRLPKGVIASTTSGAVGIPPKLYGPSKRPIDPRWGNFSPKDEPDDGHDKCRISSVYHWPNGMAMVFCEHGQQMPYYQGPSEIMGERITAKLAEQGGAIVRHMPSGSWEGF